MYEKKSHTISNLIIIFIFILITVVIQDLKGIDYTNMHHTHLMHISISRESSLGVSAAVSNPYRPGFFFTLPGIAVEEAGEGDRE